MPRCAAGPSCLTKNDDVYPVWLTCPICESPVHLACGYPNQRSTSQTARNPARAYRTICFPCYFLDRQQQRLLLEEDGAFASSGDEGDPNVVVDEVVGDRPYLGAHRVLLTSALEVSHGSSDDDYSAGSANLQK